jgi:hypothetical protein
MLISFSSVLIHPLFSFMTNRHQTHAAWTHIEGCMHVFNLTAPAALEIIGHCHGNCMDASRRLDFGYV